jgi:hypothetical protein
VTTRANPGYGSKFFLSTDGTTFAPVAQLKRFTPSTVSKQTMVDRTNILTPDNFTRTLAVRVDSGDIQLDGVLDAMNTNILSLGQAHANLTLLFFKVVLTDGTQYTFQGFVSEYTPFSVAYDKVITFSAKVRVNGAYSGPLGNA